MYTLQLTGDGIFKSLREGKSPPTCCWLGHATSIVCKCEADVRISPKICPFRIILQ